MVDIQGLITKCYYKFFGNEDIEIASLPRSGSDRQYFRISSGKRNVIGTYNPVREENDAFVGFTKHFREAGMKVPEIFGYMINENVYFQQDLGDINLYTWLKRKQGGEIFDHETKLFYDKVLDALLLFQTKGIKDLDLGLCYPHKSFDRQSMMWDMNYFKYMLLKLLAISFNEQLLEHDFISLADYLLTPGQDYFLYRDFQTANIMIFDGEPWFIDYQGGRKGASQYDLASLLYDAKVQMQPSERELFLKYYTENFCSVTGEEKDKFSEYYNGFCMIRLMQALGAFGFRGLYEHKPTFTDSIVPGVRLLIEIINKAEDHLKLPELFRAVRSIPESRAYRDLKEGLIKGDR
jgi:aminoglycoside/choline kinase family phosphotransferase